MPRRKPELHQVVADIQRLLMEPEAPQGTELVLAPSAREHPADIRASHLARCEVLASPVRMRFSIIDGSYFVLGAVVGPP
jgi:hypothetical protein